MSVLAPPPLEPVTLQWSEVFGDGSLAKDGPFLTVIDWDSPVGFFVGRNGSGKSRTANAIAQRSGGRWLATDRLVGLMTVENYGWTSAPRPSQSRGMPLGDQERQQASNLAQQYGTGVEELYALREQPDVWLRVAAFMRRALGRTIELHERSGFLDPHVRVGDHAYSLLRDEGHGLRELVVLLTGVYRRDWSLLVVDEPELHLHPSLARLWLVELEAECRSGERRAIVVTHEPSLLRPRSAHDMSAIWLFTHDRAAQNVGAMIQEVQTAKVDSSLRRNPELVSQLVFSPRPVLVEGKHDVAALSTALERIQPPEAVAQTDFVDCGGTGGVALWFEIASQLGLDIRAVADLDALFETSVQRAVDLAPGTGGLIRDELKIEPPTTQNALRPLQEHMAKDKVEANARSKARWVAELNGEGDAARRDSLIKIYRQAGIWMHPQGRLEQVLGIEEKGAEQASIAASAPGAIDDVAYWCAYSLDPSGDVRLLLEGEVERVAHNIIENLRLTPDAQFNRPIGPTGDIDERLVDVASVGAGRHRLTVKTPVAFAGYWVEFARDTPATDLNLQAPS